MTAHHFTGPQTIAALCLGVQLVAWPLLVLLVLGITYERGRIDGTNSVICPEATP